jgi:hypothetical protein
MGPFLNQSGLGTISSGAFLNQSGLRKIFLGPFLNQSNEDSRVEAQNDARKTEKENR